MWLVPVPPITVDPMMEAPMREVVEVVVLRELITPELALASI